MDIFKTEIDDIHLLDITENEMTLLESGIDYIYIQ